MELRIRQPMSSPAAAATREQAPRSRVHAPALALAVDREIEQRPRRCCVADRLAHQLAVGDKSNEIVAVPKLLQLLSLKGRIVTADAMSCLADLPGSEQRPEQHGGSLC